MTDGDGQAIVAQDLSKFYGSFAAIQDISFSIPQGQVVAFLGPNGAGKSTTIKILTGYLSPTTGKASIAGLDVTEHRLQTSRKIGYMPENGPLYPDMTPRGLLTFTGEARGLPVHGIRERIHKVTEQCGLDQVLDKPIHKLSRGYRQRVGMANCLLHDPEILILDEPTSGLDPNQVRGVREMIKEMGQSKTILLTTHILQEVEAMAGRVILVSAGRLKFDGSVDEMKKDGRSLDEVFYELTGGKS